MKISEDRGPFSFSVEADSLDDARAMLHEWRESIPDRDWRDARKDGSHASTERSDPRYYESDRSFSGHNPVVSRIGFQPNREETPGT